MRLSRNPGVFPGAWAVHDVASLARDNQIGLMLEAQNFDARRQAFVKGRAPQLEQCEEPEKVSLLERQSGRVAIKADLKCRGMVIDADTFFPGWVATVD